ncbi:MAG: cation:proton antiporter [Polyangiaceae bacterium]|nr:cation:proton antiporter [Polyangiaceae bacterium]
MSATTAAPSKGILVRMSQALALAATFGLMLGARHLVPTFDGTLATIAAIGLLLLAGTLVAELLEPLRLPHLTGYLLAGVLAGPYVLHLVEHDAVARLSPVNTLALALIALAGGVELDIAMLRKVMRSLVVSTLVQSVLVFAVLAGAFLLLAPFIPFVRDLGSEAILGVALLWGVLSVSRSPAACLAVLSQTRAKGPVAGFSLAFIMTSDVVVVVMLAVVIAIVRPMLVPGAELSVANLELVGYEIVASICVGTTLGIVLAIYLKLLGRQLLLLLIALSFGVTEALHYLHFEPLLTFLSAGFVVRNLSRQGPVMLSAIMRTGEVVYVVFFATAGAHLDLPLLRELGPIALALCAVRALATWLAARGASALARDEPVIRRWGWSGLVSQAGLTLGLGVVIERQFPELTGFGSLVVATVAVNEIVGPVLFKLALDRTGESAKEGPEARSSLPATSE